MIPGTLPDVVRTVNITRTGRVGLASVRIFVERMGRDYCRTGLGGMPMPYFVDR